MTDTPASIEPLPGVTVELRPLPQVVCCGHCGAPVGMFVERDTVEVFKPWALYFRSLDDRFGYCEFCGGKFYWMRKDE